MASIRPRVTCVRPDRSTLMTKRSLASVAMPRENAIFFPSGDHAGCQSSRALDVRRRVFDPSAFIIQIPRIPSRVL